MPADNHVLSSAELDRDLLTLGGWQVVNGHLARSYCFSSFESAMRFMQLVAVEARRLDHHPNWSNVYNRVEVELWSHELGGVSRLCIELAAEMNRVAGEC